MLSTKDLEKQKITFLSSCPVLCFWLAGSVDWSQGFLRIALYHRAVTQTTGSAFLKMLDNLSAHPKTTIARLSFLFFLAIIIISFPNYMSNKTQTEC